jgi:hypothetical protein
MCWGWIARADRTFPLKDGCNQNRRETLRRGGIRPTSQSTSSGKFLQMPHERQNRVHLWRAGQEVAQPRLMIAHHQGR